MSPTTQPFFMTIWLISGVIPSLTRARRRHWHWHWTMLGPKALPILAERRAGETPQVAALRPGPVEPGPHLLLGIDGSPAAAHAATTAVPRNRVALTRLTGR